MRDDLKPLPAHVQWWRRTRNRRARAWVTMKSVVARLLTLAMSVLGATLISFGVYSVYRPAGFVIGGIMCWVLLWSHEKDKGRRE